MNILFIYSLNTVRSPLKPLRTPEVIQMGISYISSVLKARGHSTRLVVLSRESGRANSRILRGYIKDFKPGLICFSSISSEYDFISSIAAYIKKIFPDIYLMIGGPHVSLNPESVLGIFNALCIGEGEGPVAELVSQLEKNRAPSGIPNLWIKNGSGVEKNPTRPFIEDLDGLPFPDRGMWKEWIDEIPRARETVLLGRGCPFECTYCCNHALKKIAAGPYVRFRSPDNILNEIRAVSEKYNEEREIYLEVESIGLNKEWVLELCSKTESFNKDRDHPVSFGANIRIAPNLDLETLFQALKRGGFNFINIGLESGSERVRRDILKRNYSNDDIVKAVKLARECGLRVSFLNLIGVPGETLSDFKETIKINRMCLPDWAGVSIFYPYPATKLYAVCKEQGLLKGPVPTELERNRAVLDLPRFTKKQIENGYVWFEYLVYKEHRPARRLLLNVFFLKIRSRPYFYFMYRKFKNIVFFALSIMSMFTDWNRQILARNKRPAHL